MNIVPFSPDHMRSMRLQQAQSDCPYDDEQYLASLALAGPAVSGIIDGEVMFCVGRVEWWANRYLVWSALSSGARKHMLAITRAMKRLLETRHGDGRHEVIVRQEFEEGHRWAAMLGFKFHHYEERFLPDGGDASIYVRYL